MANIAALIGVVLFIAIGYALSSNRKAINWRTILWAFGLQVVFGVLILKTSAGVAVFFIGFSSYRLILFIFFRCQNNTPFIGNSPKSYQCIIVRFRTVCQRFIDIFCALWYKYGISFRRFFIKCPRAFFILKGIFYEEKDFLY